MWTEPARRATRAGEAAGEVGGDSGCGRPVFCPSLPWDLSHVLSSRGASVFHGRQERLDQQQQGLCEHLLKEQTHTPLRTSSAPARPDSLQSQLPPLGLSVFSAGLRAPGMHSAGGGASLARPLGQREAKEEGFRDALTVTKSLGSGR